MEKSRKKGRPLSLLTIQKKKNTPVLFVENYIEIRCQLKSEYDVRIGFIKNAPTHMLIMFVVVTAMTFCKATVAYMYMLP